MFRLRIIGDVGFEFWQDIPEYEELYQASTYGRIKSKKWHRGSSSKIIFVRLNQGGYPQVTLCKDGKTKTVTSHILCAIAFLPKWKAEYTQINHKNENKTDNRVENLEWCTEDYNLHYGTGYKRRGNSNKNHPHKSKSVLQFDLNGQLLKQYPSVAEVKRELGYNTGYISSCCLGKYDQAYNFIWKYA